MLIDRTILTPIKKILTGEPKVVVVYGPRQAGKTVLLTEIIKNETRETKVYTGDDLVTQEIFSAPIAESLLKIVGDVQVLVIDEAQKIINIGSSLKLLFDARPMHILVSGSSSFDLANRLAEPMTGRATFFTLYPLAVSELPQKEMGLGVKRRLPQLLIYGMYPKVHTLDSWEGIEQYLRDLINTYLYKDVLSFEGVRKPKKIIDLLSLLALQIGMEVSIKELSQKLSLANIVVEKYLDILEKMFVVVNLRGFSRNLRKEITKTSKYYFTDLGLRNALIRNFNPLNLRSDVGAMFENFCILERMKALNNRRESANFYFWRTYDQKEIDLIEEREGKLRAFEFKWSDKKDGLTSAGKEFTSTYPNSNFEVITPEKLDQFTNILSV